ncbi:hypothetical protein QMK19_15160 [Streptomyces sp. H10-C2]|uniref:hypothetical protein n=1 Tax=unclassified Streptomyces TaxID=2593676 RepID=UPI0024BA13A3|nr:MULTISPECIES: hypothetical protein [unclassified Streptomyces]MDJ0341393.1 hypothetical protein [Streptomyces sp. PH10-H1]MDJ0370988.1 hypothetical protein [Streptomyces sp. H10-C2]
MYDPGDGGFEDEEFDPDAMVWVRGVDYVAGWREAVNAGEALSDALAAAGVEVSGLRLRAGTGPDGAGRVRVVLPALVARQVASLVRSAADRWGQAS